LTGTNYDAAIEMLQEWFGDPQQIISAHMGELIKIPNCVCDKPSALSAVYDKIMVHIRGVEALGIPPEQYGSLLIPLVMIKFPEDIRLHIARGTVKGAWKIGPLLTILKEEVVHLIALPVLYLLRFTVYIVMGNIFLLLVLLLSLQLTRRRFC